MLAGAEEHVRHVVERRQLLVRDVAEEMDVRRGQPRDERVQHGEVALEAAVRADEQQPRPRVVIECDRRERRGSRLRTSCSGITRPTNIMFVIPSSNRAANVRSA